MTQAERAKAQVQATITIALACALLGACTGASYSGGDTGDGGAGGCITGAGGYAPTFTIHASAIDPSACPTWSPCNGGTCAEQEAERGPQGDPGEPVGAWYCRHHGGALDPPRHLPTVRPLARACRAIARASRGGARARAPVERAWARTPGSLG